MMRQRLLKVLFFSGLGIIILSVVFVEYSMSPQFCNSCHNMEPYYDAWKTSTHDFVPCVDCHYTPGLQSQAKSKFEALNQVVSYFTRTYGSRPRAEINDWSCLRSECHSQRLLQGRVDFEGINFDHQPHLVEVKRGLKLRCTSCHSQIVQGTHMTVTRGTCFLCHFKGVKIGESISGCPSCHPPPERTIEFEGVSFNHKEVVEREIMCTKCHVQVVQGNGEVPQERCLICHGEPERIERYDETELIHSKHVFEHKVDCEECHNAIQHGLVKMASSLEVECSSCHPDHHSEVKELYMGVGGREVPANPSSMFTTRVGCNGCHLVHKEIEGIGSIKTAGEASCIHCHGTKFHGMLENWKKEISDSQNILSNILERADKIVAGRKKSSGYSDALRSLETARYNLRIIEMGGGVHNVGYSIELLENVYGSIRKSLRDVGSDYRPEAPRLVVTSGPSKQSCSTCHVGMKDVKLRIFGLSFSHSPHLEKGMDCLDCHEGLRVYSEEGHGVLKLSSDDCSRCHHSGERFECSECHGGFQTKAISFRGKVFIHKDHLEKTKAQCSDCHPGTIGTSVSVGSKVDCYSCHHRSEDLACESCHTLQDMFFRGKGVEDVTAEPNVMMDMVACLDCHQGIEDGHSREAVKETCIDCHDEEYGEMMVEWQESTTNELREIEGMLNDRIDREVKARDIEGELLIEAMKSAGEKIKCVNQDGSRGVHNPSLARSLIKSAVDDLRRVSTDR